MLQLSQSYMCSLFSALIGSSSGMGAGQAGPWACSALCPYYFLHRQFSAFQLPLKHQHFCPCCVQEEYFETRCRGILCRGLLCTSNFREQLLLDAPIFPGSFIYMIIKCHLWPKLRFKTHSAAVCLKKKNLLRTSFQCPFYSARGLENMELASRPRVH